MKAISKEFRSLMLMQFERLYNLFSEFYSHTPGHRYLRLFERHPRITDIASYGDIASYLNILRGELQKIKETNIKTSE